MDFIYSSNVDRDYEKEILQPFIHTLQAVDKQKNTFSKLARAINFWFKLPEDRVKKIQAIVTNLATSHQILEDLVNDSVLRKGIPTANSVYGVPATLNTFYYEHLVLLEKLKDLGGLEALKIYTDHGKDIMRGQAMEVYWRDNGLCPSEQEYIKMAKRKYGESILFVFRLMQLLGHQENKFDFKNLAEKLGVFIQVYEDYQNLISLKTDFLAVDGFSEGKFTFPVVYAVKNSPECGHIVNVVKKRSKSEEIRKYCVKLLEKCGSFDYTRQMLATLMEEIMEEVDKLGENPYLVQILEVVSESLDM